MTKGKEHLETIGDSLDLRRATIHSVIVYCSIPSVSSSLTQFESPVPSSVLGLSSQSPSIVWPGQKYRTIHYSGISSQASSFSLGLGLEAMLSKQQVKATCFSTARIALTRTHLSWGCPCWLQSSYPQMVFTSWFAYSDCFISRKAVLRAVVSMCKKARVRVGYFSWLVLFLFWFKFPFISSDKPERTRVEQRDVWGPIRKTGGSWGCFLKRVFQSREHSQCSRT